MIPLNAVIHTKDNYRIYKEPVCSSEYEAHEGARWYITSCHTYCPKCKKEDTLSGIIFEIKDNETNQKGWIRRKDIEYIGESMLEYKIQQLKKG